MNLKIFNIMVFHKAVNTSNGSVAVILREDDKEWDEQFGAYRSEMHFGVAYFESEPSIEPGTEVTGLVFGDKIPGTQLHRIEKAEKQLTE